MKLITKISWISLVLFAIVSCLKEIYEPDVWWQIKTGNWILEHGRVPTVDVFSFTYAGEAWINVKWGSEVLMALINNWFGVEFLPLLQVIVLLLIIRILTKTSRLVNSFNKNISTNRFQLGLIWAFIIMLFLVNFRLNGRPEMFSHLFSVLVIFISLKYKSSNSNLVYLLIPIQIVWTNMHEAYGIGMIIMGIFAIAFWVEHLFLRKKYGVGISFKPIKYLISWIIAVLAIGINPNGFKMISHPFNILSQLSENKFTEELISIGTEGYWKFQSIGMMILAALVLLNLLRNRNGPILISIIGKIGLGYSIVLASFLYLSFSSFRNIPFFIFAITPLLAYSLSTFKNDKIYASRSSIFTLAIVLASYILITTNTFYENIANTQNRDRIDTYGLKIDERKTPIGASNFIKNNNIDGKGFVDYLSSSYLLYDNENFKSYLDLRDLDIFPSNFIQNVYSVYFNPKATYNNQTLWEFVDSVDKFNYVVLLNNPKFINLNQHLLHERDDFVLVYGDLLNSIFLRNTPENKDLIEKYGYDGKKAMFNSTTYAKAPLSATTLSKLLWPFYKADSEKKQNTVQQDAQLYYQYMGIVY